jgi:hypothetical protein
MRKYRNRKVTVDGVTYDSQKEYDRWCELCLLQKAGKITKLERQVKFELIPAQKRTVLTGERYVRNNLAKGIIAGMPKTKEVTLEQACVYVADFVYREDGRKVVEDTKHEATKTKDYIIKRKLMLWIHGIKIREV